MKTTSMVARTGWSANSPSGPTPTASTGPTATGGAGQRTEVERAEPANFAPAAVLAHLPVPQRRLSERAQEQHRRAGVVTDEAAQALEPQRHQQRTSGPLL
jgi:hypothetical protein